MKIKSNVREIPVSRIFGLIQWSGNIKSILLKWTRYTSHYFIKKIILGCKAADANTDDTSTI